MAPDTKIVTKKIVTTQRTVLFLSRLDASGSDFANLKIPLSVKYFRKDGSKQDKSYGLGRVVFHRTEPAVAAQAVSI